MPLIKLRCLLFIIILGLILSFPLLNFAQETADKLTLSQTIEAAVKANLRLQQSQDEVEAAQATKRGAYNRFFADFECTLRLHPP